MSIYIYSLLASLSLWMVERGSVTDDEENREAGISISVLLTRREKETDIERRTEPALRARNSRHAAKS